MSAPPPPAQLLGRQDLLPGGVGCARLRQPVAFGQAHLLHRAVGVRTAAAVGAVGVEPGEVLPSLDVGLEVALGIAAGRSGKGPGRRVEAAVAVRPVGEREVVVEGDEVDRGARPELVEVGPEPAGIGVRDTHPARPVRGIADEVVQAGRVTGEPGGVERGPHVVGEPAEPIDEGIVPGSRAVRRHGAGERPARPADRLEPAQLRADQEQVDAAGEHAEVGVVQDHAAPGPVGRAAGVADGEVRRVAGELRRRRRAEEAGHRRAADGGAVGAGEPDAAAPGIARCVHQQERVEHGAVASRAQVAQAAHHARVRRRATVDGVARGIGRERDQASRRLGEAGAAPRLRRPGAVHQGVGAAAGIVGRRMDLALRHVRRRAEPRHDQRHRGAARQLLRQLVERDLVVRARPRGVEVEHRRRGVAGMGGAARQRVVHPLAGGRQQAHADGIGHGLGPSSFRSGAQGGRGVRNRAVLRDFPA